MNKQINNLINRLDLAIIPSKMSEKREKIYPKGMMTFKKHDNAPDFVLGSLVVTPNDLFEWLKTQEEHSSMYNEKKQWRFQILDGDNGPYLTLDPFKSTAKATNETSEEDSLPF